MQSTGMGPEVQGGYAEYVRIGLPESIKIPKGVSWDFATLVEPLAVGLHGVRISKFKQGHRALVIGAGPIGLATIQWLRFFGARHIVVAEISEERKAMAEKMGASLVIDGKTPADELANIYQEETGGSPDIIFECAGIPTVIQNCLEIAAPFSEIVVIGVCDKPDTFMPFLGIIKELTLKFAIAYVKDDFQFTIDMMEQGRINPAQMISQQIGFDSLPTTFESLKTSKDQCKVMICPNH
jgi:(R,R)-butanediol dehydrogenase/meso-butanediol dehydrogenase/diacetyl reductase